MVTFYRTDGTPGAPNEIAAKYKRTIAIGHALR